MRKNNKYSREFKLKVVKKYLNESCSLQDITREFKIPSKTQIHNWIKEYEKEGEEAFKFEKRGSPKERRVVKDNYIFESLEDEIRFLRMENEYLKRLCEMLKYKFKN